MKENTPKELKIAFIGWNPFQLIHVSSLIKKIPNSVFILEIKHNNLSNFDKSLLNHPDIPVLHCKSKNIHNLDAIYDVIICQTVFTDIHKFKKTKIAMIQYGYAKEAHNFGAWRCLADICFTYGPYASQKISYFCPIKEIGYFRKNTLEDQGFQLAAKEKYKNLINPNKKTLLYLPTWGKHSSVPEYIDSIIKLKDKYNVLVKLHHNADILEAKKTVLLKNQVKHLLGANDDSLQLILISDVVISDYSGAIFDAMFCRKPIVLLNSRASLSTSNFESISIECQKREKLGHVVSSTKELDNSLTEALNDKNTKTDEELHTSLFSEKKDVHKIIIRTLKNLLKQKESNLSQQQAYLRHTMQRYYSLQYSSVRYKTLNTLQIIYSKVLMLFK